MNLNQYDDPLFFNEYRKMDRSVQGLDGAGEWPALAALLPDLRGKKMLDLGCGFGWHCQYALDQGAAGAVGVEMSANMLAEGRRRFPAVQFIQQDLEEAEFPDQSFDLVLSSLVFHYLPSLGPVFRSVHRWLKPGGDFVFSQEHPVFTAAGPQKWAGGDSGRPGHWPVDRYFEPGERRAVFLGREVVKHHRPLTLVVGELLAAGFELVNLTEPTPSEEMLQTRPEMREELRRPMMLIMAVRKKTGRP